MFKKIIAFCSILLVCSLGFAQEGEQTDNQADEKAKTASRQGMIVTRFHERGDLLASQLEITWFELANERLWMVSQASRSEGLGQALVVGVGAAQTGAVPGFSGLKDLLPSFGWHAHYFDYSALLNMSEAGRDGWLKKAMSVLPQSQRMLLIAQGQACLDVGVQVIEVQPFALVCVDVPVDGLPLQVRQRLQPLVDVKVPTLVLQHAPHRWPAHQAVGKEVELHLLPRLSGQDRLLKRIRGWLKRRHKI